MGFNGIAAQNELFNLSQTAEKLGVKAETLLTWNELNILKPTITQSGEIGYTKEQIDHFLSIQKLTHASIINSEKTSENIATQVSESVKLIDFAENPSENLLLTGRIENADSYTVDRLSEKNSLVTQIAHKNQINNKIVGLGFASAFIVVLGVMLFFPFSTEKDIANDTKNEASKSVLASKTSRLDIPEDAAPTISISLKEKETEKKLTISENKSVIHDSSSDNKIFAAKQISNTARDSQAKKTTDKKNATAQSEKKSSSTSGTNSAEMTGYSFIAGIASSIFCPTCDEDSSTSEVFDEGGNLKGETENSDLLVSAIGGLGTPANSEKINENANANITITLFGLGLISLYFLFKKGSKGVQKSGQNIHESNNIFDGSFLNNKILEINQKTDGTVALSFDGKEFKICKPELDSESDQFIGRLMELISPEVKEIDYDVIADEKMKVAAPLSKLVTRLGFVGLKRDLFFPRTSKTRVLFRRFVTEKDLLSMNLTREQLLSELTLSY